MAIQHLLFQGHPHGIGANYMIILGALHLFDTNQYTGFNCAIKNGLYYDSTGKPNWWENYFQPIKVGDLTTPFREFDDTMKEPFLISERLITRVQNNGLINKYIHLLPHMQTLLNNFTTTHLSDVDYILGVHYRGTEKNTEAEILPFSRYTDQVKTVIDGLPEGTTYKIFVATDEQFFLDHINKLYPGKIVTYDRSCRSMDGLNHYKNMGQGTSKTPCAWSTPYYLGESALMDSYILAESSFLIRSDSNLSMMSTFINPEMPVIQLTFRKFL